MSNQNRFKFTVKQNNYQTSNSNNTNRSQFQNSQFNQTNCYNQNNNQNQTKQLNNNIFKQPSGKINDEILIDDKEDDDLLDISDTELIRASQVVESQLKFTNNVHHTTSNALTIFSQFNSNNDCGNLNVMGPPSTTTIYSNSHFSQSNNDPFAQIDEIRNELKQVKSENMQKDGEVKILRDKLKRLEQDTQKMRAEKIDLIKKLQQQQDEAKKVLQKQIEFKELENQFKSQEIVELTMKYKVLESTVRKNPALSSTPAVTNIATNLNQNQFNQPQTLFEKQIQNQKFNALQNTNLIQQPKSVPTKRSAQPLNNNLYLSLSDNENENPILDIKRPLLSTNCSNNKSNNTCSNQMRPPLSPYSNNTPIIQPNKQETKVFNNTPHILNQSKTKNIKQQNFKRTCVLNTKVKNMNNIKNKENNSIHNDNSDLLITNEKIYKLTDQFSEFANYLFKFNSTVKNKIDSNDSINQTSSKISSLNISNLYKKLNDLNLFIRNNLKFDVKQPKDSSVLINLDRVEFVSNRLNDELIKLIDYCLKTSLITTSNDMLVNDLNSNLANLIPFSLLENNTKTSSASVRPTDFKSFIDMLCLSFELSYNLFLFRVNYLLLNHSTDLTNKSYDKSITYEKLIKLKEKFFLLISQLLESINFSQSIKQKNLDKQKQQAHSFSSYSTLKIFNTVLDCLNDLIYLPSLAHIHDPYSLITSFYFGLADNLHSIFNNIKIINTKKDIEIIQEKSNNIQCQKEDDHCLFQLFYEKLIKYFGDIVYALEPNESSKSNEEQTLINNIAQSNQQQQQQMQIITTIAADDSKNSKIDFKLETRSEQTNLTSSTSQTDLYNEIFQSQIDTNNTKNETNNNLNNTNVPFLNSNLNINNNSNCNSNSNNNNNNNNNINNKDFNLSLNNCIDYLNIKSINYLKIEFVTKFIYFLHNYQLNQSLENKMINKSLSLKNSLNKTTTSTTITTSTSDKSLDINENLNKKRKIYESMTNLNSNQTSCDLLTCNKKCNCYKDMLNIYLILIDYQLNEKFMFNSAKLNVEEYFEKYSSPSSKFLFSNQINNNLIDYDHQINNMNLAENIDLKDLKNLLLNKHIGKDLIRFKNEKYLLNENKNQFIYFLMLLSLNTFICLFNNGKYDRNILNDGEINSDFQKQKISYLDSVRIDYRLKNFLCLYKLADSNFDHSLCNHKSQDNQAETMEINGSPRFETKNIQIFKYDHLKYNLNSLKNLFKVYIDDYFDFV